MERKPMIIYLDNLKKSPKSLYYKKIIRSKNKYKWNSYSMDNDKHNITQKIKNSSLDKSNENPLYIKEYQTLKGNKKSLYSINKNKYKDKFNNLIMPYNKLNLIIKIQKYVRGFIIRKKMEQFHINIKSKINLMKTANPIRIKKKLNLSILDAFKRNSKNQKTFIKLANNRFNERNTVNARNVKNPPNNKNNLIYISKDIVRKKNYSFDFKKESEIKNNNKVDNISNVYQNAENNYNSNKKNENKVSLESELSFSNITNEQQPQNINTICENETNETNENNSKIINNNNINNNNELLENKKKDIIKECNINSKVLFKNKRNLVLPDCKSKSYYLSSFQTKENSASDRNYVENNNNVLLDSPRKNTQRSSQGMNNEKNTNDNKIEDKKEKDKNKNGINLSLDYYAKDEFDSDDNYQKIKNNFNLINTNIKQGYNPMLNQSINNQNKILNKNNKISNLPNVNNMPSNIYPHGKFSYKINIPIKKEINNNDVFESIKEEKFTEFDNDLKSSFYDNEEFIIINYDYTLNEKKKMENSFKIDTVETICITGIPPNKAKLINTLKKVIYKGVKLYIFNYLKELKQEENEMDKSLTMNDSCSYVPQSRIQKNKINNNNISSHNILKFNNKNKQKEHNNDVFKEIELFRNKNLDSS